MVMIDFIFCFKVGMCGVGQSMIIVECQALAGPTDATLTTEVDNISNSTL